MIQIEPERFEEMVVAALDGLPEQLGSTMRNVAVTVEAGQAVHARPGEWVRYSTPGEDGAEYVSVCLPAFAPDTVHRDG